MQVFVIDREHDRDEFLGSVVPDAVYLEIGVAGDAGAVINPWDVEDAAAVPASKIAFLMRLHALLVGEHEHHMGALGLSALERDLLATSVRDVYARAADGEGAPSEGLLREVLIDLARQERADPLGSAARERTFADLASRLRDVCAGGRFGHVLDRPTRADVGDAPLVIIDTASVPEEVAAVVLLTIVEFVTARAQLAPAGHVSLLADIIDDDTGLDDELLPQAFPRESLLNGLHGSYTRRRMRTGEPHSIAYLHAISDVAHFLHPPTALSRGERP